MSQIAIVQPAAPPVPPAGPPANSGSQEFSSHFEKAISARKDQANTRESAKENNPEIKKTGEKNPTASVEKQTEEKATSATVPEQDVAAEDAEAPIENEAIDTQSLLQESPFPLSTEEQPMASAVFSLPAKNTTTPANTHAAAAAQDASPAFTNLAPRAFIVSSPVPAEVASSLPEATTSPQTGQKPTDTLLAQLQQLIQNNNEKGTVTITREDTPAVVSGNGIKGIQAWPQQVGTNQINIVSSEYAGVPSESPHFMLADGWNAPHEKSDQQVSSLRQNSQQQYYEAKINLQSFGKNDESAMQDGQKGNESTAQASIATGQAASTATSLAADQTNTFAQSLTTAQNTPLQPGSEAVKTVTLPSGTVVREEEVLQQVMERFQISRKPLDTQINIKLHPAELGELKIDLTVKEGSIRANVIAQSQHAQEIIERNMSKLRTVLEDHGFTVEKITVSAKSDSTADTGLFDRQLSGQSDYTPQPRKRRHEAEAAFRLDEAFFTAQPATTGVNVKI